jgi:hypothetical protein
VGVVADGQYQNEPFLRALRDQLGMSPDDKQRLPITWDPAHFLNLAVTDVRDGPEGLMLRRFIKRTNRFASLFGRGRGYAALQATSEKGARAISSFAAQRFASSAMKQWHSIASSYEVIGKYIMPN